MSEWRKIAIADIAAPSKNALVGGPFGSNLVSRDYTPSGVPVIRGQNMGFGRWVSGEFVFVSNDKSENLSANIAKPGDLIFTQRGTLGQVAIVPPAPFDRYVISQSQMKLTVDSAKADAKFLFYFFTSEEQQDYIRRNAIQTGVPHTNLGHLRTTPLFLPPLSEQRAIASVLGALDDKIELNRRMNETLEAMARALFQNWFVDATQAGLPKGWRYATISELCDINSWTLNKGDELDRIEYVEISEVSRGNIGSIQVFQRGEEPSRARRRLRHGDTVLSTVRPERGSYFLCLNPSPNLIASTGFAVVTPTKAPWSLIHAALTHPEVSQHLGHQADGGAYPAVRPEIIGKWELPWPDKPEKVKQFHRACAPLYERAEHNRLESRTLAAMRDALLPKLLSGELRVPAAAKLVDATV
ncbi:MAG: restriction endonuclease subunit S [Verrucomicrobia bacterium]|nr:restriction endonuclease subunit S [Verrucomicrobiota bacterium]